MVPLAPRNTAVLLAPSLPTFSSSTRAFFHMCLGRRSSWRRTMSPVLTFPDPPFGWEISWKFLNCRRYSFSRLQKSSAIFRVLWCVLVRFPSVWGSIPEGSAVSFAPQRKCAGVNASSVSCVMGLEFKAASMLTTAVANSSSVACDRPNTFRRHLLVVPTILSHQPPYQPALGALNFQVIPNCAMRRWALVAERASHNSASSLFDTWNV